MYENSGTQIHTESNEVFFPQVYKPGQWCESDFTRMKPLGVTINGVPFDHMLYHFVLCYSNWETGTVCFSESYESLNAGVQNALWKLDGVPKYHRTDNLTGAVLHADYQAGCSLPPWSALRVYRP